MHRRTFLGALSTIGAMTARMAPAAGQAPAAPQPPVRSLSIETFFGCPAAELATFCRQWSATARDTADLDRIDAQRLWQMRILLPPEQQLALDRLPLTTQAQLAELYHDVWSAALPARRA